MLAAGLLPLKHYADFRGRSTRTEVVGFWLLIAFISFALQMLLADWHAGAVAVGLFGLAVLCPGTALMVRRLHDQGRSGWWALLGSPAVLFGAWSRYRDAQDPFWMLKGDEPSLALSVAAAASGLIFIGLLLLPPQGGPNRYGADPRDDPDIPY
jgi:uncharacterized membrane protein YhaH (DUF805 family)